MDDADQGAAHEPGVRSRAGYPHRVGGAAPQGATTAAPMLKPGGCREVAALTGRVALVTGASWGIGAGLATMLAGEGARVVLAARRGGELERVAAGIRRAGGTALPVVTDLADDDSMARLLS